MNNSVKKCCICNNEKMGEFITINDNKYHLCCIEELKADCEDLFNQKEMMFKNMQQNQLKVCELAKENNELMRINEGVHKAREKDTETINELAMVLVNLREWLEEDKDKINVLDTKNNSSVKLGIVIGLGMCLDKLNELEGKNE